jgi:hypothetical protein
MKEFPVTTRCGETPVGIYVQTFAAKPLLRSGEKLAGQIIASARNWAVSRGLEALFFAGEPRAKGVSLSVYPPAGGIDFEITGGRVSFGVKTSIAGPGYHHALIDLCDRLEKEVGLKWRWDACGDQTGYAGDRDKRALQEKHALRVEALCKTVGKYKTSGQSVTLHLPLDLARGECDGVATPAGPVPHSHFERALSVPEEMLECVSFLMPWHSDSLDDRFWADTLRAILWTLVEWRAPRTPWELHVQRAAAACYGRLSAAKRLEFIAAMAELNILAESPLGTVRPVAEGIGWKRRMRSFPITGPWQIRLPGYYVDEVENDTTDCVWFSDEEIRGSSFVVKRTVEGPLDWSEEYMDSPEHRIGKNIYYRISNEFQPLPDREDWVRVAAQYHTMRGDKTHHILLLSVYAERSEAVRRIEEIAGRVWFDPNCKTYESIPSSDAPL